MRRKGLIVSLLNEGVLKTPLIIRAFEAVDRRDFVPSELDAQAYLDVALPIGFGQTISQPYTVAFMLELLQPEKGQRVLDVGAGSGWTTALLAHIVGPRGKVIGTEIVPELAVFGQLNLRKYHFNHANIRLTDTLGAIEEGPCDRILVSATARELSRELLDQLGDDGILVEPVGSAIIKVYKPTSGRIATEQYEGFAFVPLITNP